MSAGESAYSVILFHTNSAALRAEKILLQKNFTIKLIPVPRQLSSDCGIALRFDRNCETLVREALADVPIGSIHAVE